MQSETELSVKKSMLLLASLVVLPLLAPTFQEDLDASVKLWLEMAQPTLSASSVPLLLPTGSRSRYGATDSKCLGFSEPADRPTGSCLVGCEIFPLDPASGSSRHLSAFSDGAYPSAEKAAWSEDTLRKISDDQPGWIPFRENQRLCAGIVSEIAGQHEFAVNLLSNFKFLGLNASASDWPFGKPASQTLQAYTAETIVEHLVFQLLDPAVDRQRIVTDLEKLQSTHLINESHDHELSRLIASCKASITIHRSAPGTPEALVENLVDATDPENGGSAKTDPRMTALTDLGPRAVPALAKYLKSTAFTHALVSDPTGELDSPVRLLELGPLCESLIQSIAHEEVLFEGQMMTENDAMAWYRAQKEGKLDDYFIANTVDPNTVDHWGKPNTEYSRGSESAFKILVQRSPAVLIQGFQRTLLEPDNIDLVCNVIDGAEIDRKLKSSIFVLGANSRFLIQKREALRHLFKYDPTTFNQLLSSSLDQLRSDEDGSDLVTLVFLTEDATVWSALERLFLRAKSDALMDDLTILWKAGEPNVTAKNKWRSLSILRSFFTDSRQGPMAIKTAAYILAPQRNTDHLTRTEYETLKNWVFQSIDSHTRQS